MLGPLIMEEQDMHLKTDLNSHVEYARNIDTGLDHDNESTNSSDTMIAFGGSEADGHLGNLLPNSQTD